MDDLRHAVLKHTEFTRSHRFVIIAGTHKAGTTSLFLYLAAHPSICASETKETRFFLDPDFPAPAKHNVIEGLEVYESYFQPCADRSVCVDASPDYMYSRGTAAVIKQALPQVKLIFILRDPIERLVSWYRFAKQNGAIPQDMRFDEYVAKQMSIADDDVAYRTQPQWFRALDQGRYGQYLFPFFHAFERDQLCVLSYRELQHSPSTLMLKVCALADIDPSFYETYEFAVFNRTQTVRNQYISSSYRRLRRWARELVSDLPQVRGVLRKLRRKLEPAILSLNTADDERVTIPPDLRIQLEEYYRPDTEALRELLGDDWS